MMTEEEATASIMDGGACTTCQQLCGLAGKKVETRKDDCAIKNMEIPHQSVERTIKFLSLPVIRQAFLVIRFQKC